MALPAAGLAAIESVVKLGMGGLLARGVGVTRPHQPPAAPPIHRRCEPSTPVPRSMLDGMAATPTPESTPQRLTAIRAQMSLLADYL